MPPVVIDLRGADDTRDVIHRAVQALAEGKLVAFPTETVYVLACSALCEEAVARLKSLHQPTPTSPLVLAVKSAAEAVDYVPDLCPLGLRLARRCWPGPVTLVADDRHPDSLIHQLAPSVQEALAPDNQLALRVPAHRTIQDVMRLLAGPVVLAGASQGRDNHSVTATEVVESLGENVQVVLDDGRSRFGQPSSIVRVNENGFEILRQGVVTNQTLKRLASAMVLFVCTGNTCRSPMAEALFRKRVAEKLGCRVDEVEDRGVVVMSAGIAAMMGGRATLEAVAVMNEHQLDLRQHESQPVTEQLVRHADLILTMTRSHQHAVISEWPDAADRVKLLCHDGSDVADPVGGPVELYRRCAEQLAREIDRWVEEIPLY